MTCDEEKGQVRFKGGRRGKGRTQGHGRQEEEKKGSCVLMKANPVLVRERKERLGQVHLYWHELKREKCSSFNMYYSR